MKRILLILTLLLTTGGLCAAPADSIRLSLLTCEAGGEIYSLFGHTALRYENPTRGIDVVFNYGLFDFGAPHFILRFALGETDYRLGATEYRNFAAEYNYLGRDVWQQVLNLTAEEKERLVALLEENYLPENRVYRYNFFYDNCATRPRDMVERAIEGRLVYADDMESTDEGITFRDLLHLYSEGHPWSRFGMDLCMGSQADRPINRRTAMFVPFRLQACFRTAQVIGADGERRPLVTSEERVVETGVSADAHRAKGYITPAGAAGLLLLLTALATLYGIRRQKTLWEVDFVLFLAAGVAGCILAFLALLSQHPAVSPNYLLFVFHPFHLLCLPCMLRRVRKGLLSRYMLANAIVLTLFTISLPLIPQKIGVAAELLALCLLLRSAGNLILIYRRSR